MISIKPVYEHDQDPFSRYFREEFISLHHGHRAEWQGCGIKLLGLNEPVTLTALQNLLRGQSADGSNQLRTSARNNERELGWWITFDAPPSMTVLWALAPEPIRTKVEDAHLKSVMWALIGFEAGINGWDGRSWESPDGWTGFPRDIFAKFTSGAAYDQTPQLRTNAFLFNLAINRDGTVGRFPHEKVLKETQGLRIEYGVNVEVQLWPVIGSFHKGPNSELRIDGVPKELVRRFTFDATFTPHKLPGSPERPLGRQQLFEAWQAQAETWGWGSRALSDFLRQSQAKRKVEQLSARVQWGFKKGFRFYYRSKRSLGKLLRDEKSRPIGNSHNQRNENSQSHSR